MTQRLVIFEDAFFDALNGQVADERTTSGTPSRTDVLAYVISPLRDVLAEDYEANTQPVPKVDGVRTLIRSTIFIPLVTLFCVEVNDVVHVYDIEFDFTPWPADPDKPGE